MVILRPSGFISKIPHSHGITVTKQWNGLLVEFLISYLQHLFGLTEGYRAMFCGLNISQERAHEVQKRTIEVSVDKHLLAQLS